MEIPDINSALVSLILVVRQSFQEVYKIIRSMVVLINALEELETKLAVQQTIFENGSRLLLYLATRSRQDVDNMYEDIEHPTWMHKKTNQDVEDLLAQFKTPCLQTLQRIQKNLTDFRCHLLSLKRREERKGKKGHQLWRTQFWSKSPSSDPAEQFPPILDDMRNCNDIFCTFVRQIVQNEPKKISSPSLLCAVGESNSHQATRITRASDSHILCYQRASQGLYEALSGAWSCHEASAHSLSMALSFNDPKVGGPISNESIWFTVCLKNAISSRSFQLAIDSTQSTTCSCLEAEGSPFSNFPERGIPESNLAASESNRATIPLRESTKGASAYETERRIFGAGTCPDLPENEVPDLDQEDELCYLDAYMSGTGTPSLGNFNSGGTMPSHSFYLVGRELHGKGSKSLDDVLMQARARGLAISNEEKLRMAVSLATGVLYLHSTSWIPQRWGSKDIMIPENDHTKDGIRLRNPYLRTQLEKTTIDYSVSDQISFTSVNSPLFFLGIVLLELAFTAPLRELQVHEDFTSGLIKREREYLTVMRLSETVSRELGSRYAKVVRTCFSQMREFHSIRKTDLDDIMANHVVKELEQSLGAVLSVEKGH